MEKCGDISEQDIESPIVFDTTILGKSITGPLKFIDKIISTCGLLIFISSAVASEPTGEEETLHFLDQRY